MPRGGARIAGPGRKVGRPPGTPNPGTGRPAISKRLKIGDSFYVTRETPSGTTVGELWTVREAGGTKLIFECGNEVIKLVS